jgi:hypothetical protein
MAIKRLTHALAQGSQIRRILLKFVKIRRIRSGLN